MAEPEEAGDSTSPPKPDIAPKTASELRSSSAPELGRSINELVTEDEAQTRASADNLDALYADTTIGRDRVGGDSHRASHGGTVNVIGGNQYLHAPPSERALRPVPLTADKANELESYVVETTSLKELRGRIRTEAVLLLRGDPHGGQFTTALAALLRHTGDAERVFWYVAGSDPLDMRPAEQVGGAAYVVDARHVEGSVPPDQIVGHIRIWSKGCKVVVLAPPAWLAYGLSIEHDLPAAEGVFAARMCHQLRLLGAPHPEEHVAKACANEHVQEELRADRHPSRAALLACKLAEAIAAGKSLNEALSDRPQLLREEVRKSLTETEPRRARCFLISSAVLHGSPAVVVVRQAVRLATHIEQELARQIQTEQPRETHVWEEFSAWTRKAKVDAEPGRNGHGRVIRLMRRGYAGITLRVVWEEQPTIHEPLLTWLQELTEHKNDWLIRMKAAQAIGVLATYDFEVIDEHFFQKWSKSRQFQHHELAAWALDAAAQDPDMTPHVHRRLQQWARGTWACRSIVTRAYGSEIGVRWIDEALVAMKKVAGAPDPRLQEAVARSISRIYRPGNALKIVSTLEQWADDRDDPSRRHTAALTFLWLVASSGGHHRIRDLAAHPEAHPSLIALWLHALASGVTSANRPAATPEAWKSLADWVTVWDRHPEVRPIVHQIVATADPALVPALFFHLRYWRRLNLISSELEAHLTSFLERN
ncbi:hypothetical protein [Nonomuraea cavernae]|uniref:hypothetical protein n=1 Tax=Nonomuraea cavernae TaxID=2045107 RepID=UPI0033DD58C0